MISRSNFLSLPKKTESRFLIRLLRTLGPPPVLRITMYPGISYEYQQNRVFQCSLSDLHGRLALLPLALPKLLEHRHLQIIAPLVVSSDRLSLGYALEARDGVVQALCDVQDPRNLSPCTPHLQYKKVTFYSREAIKS